MKEETIIEVFWTGGFDSTYRILQLLGYTVLIQPYYLSDNRESEEKELNAIKNISGLVNTKPRNQGQLLPLIYIPINERIVSKEISDAYLRIRQQHYLGSQYDWLGGFAKYHYGIELTIEKGTIPIKLINKYGKLTKISDKIIGENYVLDTASSSADINTLFQYYRFPLANITELEMRQNYIAWGCEDVMDLTWFCFNPINGKPCGECNPCKSKIKSGLTERFSEEALKRYQQRKYEYRRQKYLTPILNIPSRSLRIIRAMKHRIGRVIKL